MNSKPITDVKIITLRSRIITTPLQRGINKRPTQKQLQKQQKKNKNDDVKDEDYEPPIKMYNSSVPDDDEEIEDVFSFQEFNIFCDPHGNLTIEFNNWVSPSAIRDAMLNNHLVTWLKRHFSKLGHNVNPRTTKRIGKIINREINKKRKHVEIEEDIYNIPMNKRQKISETGDINPVFKLGIDFENIVIDNIKNKFPGQVAQVVYGSELLQHNNLTLKYMREGVPIIYQAMLINPTNKTYGVADLLVRSDYVNKLVRKQAISLDMENYKAPNLNGDYHYVAIDIKCSDMPLRPDGITLLNSLTMPACKGQLTIYNAIVGQLQGYTPSHAYILGKSWSMDSTKNKSQGNNPFDRLGVVDFDGFDNKYIKLTYDAINWVRYVRYDGDMENCLNPTRLEMIPNLSVENCDWYYIKVEIARLTDNPGLLSGVGKKNVLHAYSLGITSMMDKRCNSKTLGFKTDGKLSRRIDNKLKVNFKSPNNIEPQIILDNSNDWQTKTPLDIYIDYETLQGIFIDKINISNTKSISSFVFMIGIGYEFDGIFHYESFITTDYSIKEEYKIFVAVDDFINRLKEKHQTNVKPKLFCWSGAEESVTKTVNMRHNTKFFSNIEWCDMYKVFTNEPISIKGSFTDKLKDIAKAMKSHNMIQTDWPDNGIDNGQKAMFKAIEYYKSTNKDNSIITNIRDYNEVDCKVVWEIVNYLRQNHTK